MMIEPQIKLENSDEDPFKELFLKVVREADLKEQQIAEMIHEEIGSDLMALRMVISQSSLSEKDKSLVEKQINLLLNKIKTLSKDICPAILVEIGLGGALKNKCEALCNEHEIIIRYTEDGDKENPLNQEIQNSLYKTVTELLNSIIDQNKPSKILVNALNKSKRYSIRIEDDGMNTDIHDLKFEEYPLILERIKGRLIQMNADFNFDRDAKGSVVTINIDK